jgi:hypothetical protein
VFCGVFIAEEADGVADKGQVIPQQLMYRHSKCFLNMSLRSTCFNDKDFFLVKSKISNPWITVLKCQIIRISKLSEVSKMPKVIY